MKKLIIILNLLPLLSAAQWHKITNNDLAVISCQFIAGAADGFNQAITHHHLGRGNQFWDAELSWKNKYKDFDNGDTRPAFFGSKTILVGATDGFHLTRTIDRMSTIASIGISAGELSKYEKKDRWKVVAKKIILSAIANRIAFNITYKIK